MDELPDFLVIGAARAGTTALHRYLRQHPDIFMPRLKESNFFAYEGETLSCRGPGADFINNSVTRLADYRALFRPAREGQIKGEASPLYLFEPAAPRRIHAHRPDMKMVAVLRNPVEQAWSHYLYAVKERIEPLTDFAEAIAQEDARRTAGWQPLFGYSAFPRYAAQLERYFALFPHTQFLIRLYEDFQEQPETVLHDIFAFVGADPAFRPDMGTTHNAGGIPRNQALQDFLVKPNPITRMAGYVLPEAARRRIRDRLSQANLRRDSEMPQRARDILRERLGPEIDRLQALLGRDLDAWRG